jgi:transcriptional regulator with PAS, ATPase and Fis domain
LDEIDTFSPKLQVKLLRILQEGEFEKVGDTNTIKVDVRVVVATNQDLKELISRGQFREDLYYRLNVIPISVPPLRQRCDDIPMLVEHFLKKTAQKMKDKKIKSISSQTLRLLVNYSWPGNVRELENVIERAVILSKGNTIQPEDLPDNFHNIKIEQGAQVSLDNNSSLKEALEL